MDRIPSFLVLALGTLLLVPSGLFGDAAGAVGDMTFSRHPAPVGLTDVNQAGEPSVGINWKTGAVMFQAWKTTYRVEFDDLASPPVATWNDKTPTSSIVNVDPILFTDATLGRTFAGGLNGACSVLSFSDNDGSSWSPMSNSCAAGVDHPSIASGPWTEDGPLSASYPHAVYYCAATSVVQCASSSDGGLTFGPGTTVACGFFNPGLHGSIHVAPNGWVYLPFRTCGGWNGVSVSKDNGLTWTGRAIPGAVNPPTGFDPDVASTASSWIYAAYPTKDWGVGAALTTDGGATWTTFGDIAGAAGIASATFIETVAGDDERAAIVYFGSLTDGEPHSPFFTGVWHVYVSYTLDAGATWTTVRASENVAHMGGICAEGNSCQWGHNLFESIDAQLDRDGRILVSYADACVGACEMGYAASNGAHASLLRQAGGSGLFAGVGGGGLSGPHAQKLPRVEVGDLPPTLVLPERVHLMIQK